MNEICQSTPLANWQIDHLEKVPITGGSGLVGMALAQLLLPEGYEPRHLGREARHNAVVSVFRWQPAALQRKNLEILVRTAIPAPYSTVHPHSCPTGWK